MHDHNPTPLRITLAVTGGVAAYKAAELVRLLQQRGADVHVIMTRAAEQFIQPLTFSSLTGHKVITSLWSESPEHESTTPASGLNSAGQIEHIAEAQSPHAILIAPATAHILAKMAHGLADDFLTTMLLATRAPIVVAPAMNVNMWTHPATQANVDLLRTRGILFVPPDAGYLACGMTGSGRLANLDTVVEAVLAAATPRPAQDLAAETILITAGGTREALDPVRFLGNRSSGKMGYALAEAALQRGAQVILISAPTALAPPPGCTFVPVTSAAQMHAAVMQHLPAASIVIGAAAVADFRPPAASPEKIRRQGPLHLTLEPTEDIIRAVANTRATTDASATILTATPVSDSAPHPLIIAFAAETHSDIPRARAKLLAKGADAIILNDISLPNLGFDSESNAATFITPTDATALPPTSKRNLADRILTHTLTLRTEANAPALPATAPLSF